MLVQLFSAENMSKLQQDLSLSTRQIFRLAENLRACSGSRNIIETQMKEKIIEINHQLEDVFVAKICTFANLNETLKTFNNT